MNVQNNTSIHTVLQTTTPIDHASGTSLSRGNNNSAGMAIEPTTPNEATTETFGLEPGTEIDEEAFQNALVKYVLEDVSPEAAQSYTAAFQQAVQNGTPVEDAVKIALKAIVSEGLIPQEEAEKINGITFRAAQLDDNLDALYDGRGGPNDPTVAKASVTDAAAKAAEVLQAAESGDMKLSARSLDAASNVAPSQMQRSSSVGGGSGEFVWKPQSESNGKLVVLLPSQYSGKIVSAGIYSEATPSKGSLIEEGRFSGNANGGRAHFRFSKNGGGYPDGVYVVAKLNDGSTVSFAVGDSGNRVTQ